MLTIKFSSIIERRREARTSHAVRVYYVILVIAEVVTRRVMSGEKLEPLAEALGFTNPLDLNGKEFSIPSGYTHPDNAMNFLLIWAKQGRSYVPPTPDELLEKSIASLAKGVLPDFSGVDELALGTFVLAQFETEGLLTGRIKKAFYQRLRDELRVRTNRKVSIILITRECTPFCFHFFLIDGGKKVHMVFGPYYTPFAHVQPIAITSGKQRVAAS